MRVLRKWMIAAHLLLCSAMSCADHPELATPFAGGSVVDALPPHPDANEEGAFGEVPPDAGAVDEEGGSRIVDPRMPCNGEPRLCALRYDEGIQLTTHWSAATRVAGWTTVAQNLGFSEQLASDVPALMLEVFDAEGGLQVCNRDCAQGHTPLSILLDKVKTFLDSYTLRVVTLLTESHVPADALAVAFRSAGLESYAYTHDGSTAWPMLGNMIDAGTRLVVFVEYEPTPSPDAGDDAGGGDAAPPEVAAGPLWLHPMNRWIRRTNAAPTALGEIDCQPVAGDSTAPWILLHQHVLNPATNVPSADLSTTVNGNPTFIDRLQACRTLHGSYPTFVAVDFVELGNPQTTVRHLNNGEPWN
jgi:hypothetical protein